MNNPERAQFSQGEQLLYLPINEAFELMLRVGDRSIKEITRTTHKMYPHISHEEIIGCTHEMLHKTLLSIRRNHKEVNSINGLIRVSLIRSMSRYATTAWVRKTAKEVPIDLHPEVLEIEDSTEPADLQLERYERTFQVRELINDVLSEREAELIEHKYEEIPDCQRAEHFGYGSTKAMTRIENRAIRKLRIYMSRKGFKLSEDF